MKTLKELKALTKEYGGPKISRKAYMKVKPMDKELDEGRMKELHGYIDRGMTAQQIAKKMKLDVKTIKALMPKKESVEEDRKGMAKLAGLYSKAMRQMPGSPAQKKIKAEIEKLRKELGMNESLEEQKDDAEYNDEGGMAISQLKTAKSAVEELMSIIKDDDNLPEWVQSKLTKAVDYMDSVRDYMSSEKDDVKEGLKDGYIVYKKMGFSKIKKLATMKSMPKGKELDKVLDKYNADGVMAMSKALRNKVQVEAVSPAQQAAIAISKKERGEKPKEESRAYRDAMRGMKGNTRGMATTKKDKDTDASDDDRKAASKNIIMQLRKAADSMTGSNVEFEKGKGKVDRRSAQDVLAKFNRLQKPMDKEKFQKSIKSLADIKKILGR